MLNPSRAKESSGNLAPCKFNFNDPIADLDLVIARRACIQRILESLSNENLYICAFFN